MYARVSCALLMFLLLSASVSDAAPRWWKPKFENRLNFSPTFYFEEGGQGTTQLSAAIREEASFSNKVSNKLRFRFVPYVYSDLASKTPSETFIPDVNEANGEYRAGDFTFKFGINSVAWGVTDVYNPLDVVSSRRYMDLLNSEKRGVPSLDVSWENETWRLEGIYIPYQLESILPGENSRWLPRDITYSRGDVEGNQLILKQGFKYSYTDRMVIDSALHHNFGFRIERRASGVDLTAVFFQGAPIAPAIYTPIVRGTTIRVSPNVVLADEVVLQPTYYLRRTGGVGAVVTLETAIIRFAAAASDRVTGETTLPGWSQSVVGGVEKNFAVGESTLTALMQATYAQHEDRADNMVTSLERIFDQSWLLGLRLATSTDWSGSLAGLYDAKYKGGYVQLKVERKINDGVTASLQGDWLDGSQGTPMGTYRQNKRAILGISTFF